MPVGGGILSRIIAAAVPEKFVHFIRLVLPCGAMCTGQLGGTKADKNVPTSLS